MLPDLHKAFLRMGRHQGAAAGCRGEQSVGRQETGGQEVWYPVLASSLLSSATLRIF